VLNPEIFKQFYYTKEILNLNNLPYSITGQTLLDFPLPQEWLLNTAIKDEEPQSFSYNSHLMRRDNTVLEIYYPEIGPPLRNEYLNPILQSKGPFLYRYEHANKSDSYPKDYLRELFKAARSTFSIAIKGEPDFLLPAPKLLSYKKEVSRDFYPTPLTTIRPMQKENLSLSRHDYAFALYETDSSGLESSILAMWVDPTFQFKYQGATYKVKSSTIYNILGRANSLFGKNNDSMWLGPHVDLAKRPRIIKLTTSDGQRIKLPLSLITRMGALFTELRRRIGGRTPYHTVTKAQIKALVKTKPLISANMILKDIDWHLTLSHLGEAWASLSYPDLRSRLLTLLSRKKYLSLSYSPVPIENLFIITDKRAIAPLLSTAISNKILIEVYAEELKKKDLVIMKLPSNVNEIRSVRRGFTRQMPKLHELKKVYPHAFLPLKNTIQDVVVIFTEESLPVAIKTFDVQYNEGSALSWKEPNREPEIGVVRLTAPRNAFEGIPESLRTVRVRGIPLYSYFHKTASSVTRKTSLYKDGHNSRTVEKEKPFLSHPEKIQLLKDLSIWIYHTQNRFIRVELLNSIFFRKLFYRDSPNHQLRPRYEAALLSAKPNAAHIIDLSALDSFAWPLYRNANSSTMLDSNYSLAFSIGPNKAKVGLSPSSSITKRNLFNTSNLWLKNILETHKLEINSQPIFTSSDYIFPELSHPRNMITLIKLYDFEFKAPLVEQIFLKNAVLQANGFYMKAKDISIALADVGSLCSLSSRTILSAKE